MKVAHSPRSSRTPLRLGLFVALLCLPFWAQAAGRIALVIGNSTYVDQPKLDNPGRDADLIGNVLQYKLGYTVLRAQNVDRARMLELIGEFSQRAQNADSAVFYFSGHGMQDAGNSNYLLPVDARVKSDVGLRAYGVNANEVIKELGSASGPKVSLVILDACRNSPFSTGTKGAAKGLKPPEMNTDKQMLVAFATKDGQVAQDGTGQGNSPYARALAEQLAQAKERPLMDLLDAVSRSVRAETNNEQRPTRYGDVETGTYLLASLAPIPGTNDQPSGGGVSFEDLKKADAQEKVVRAQWAKWLSEMKSAFSAAQGFAERGTQAKAWERFIGAYAGQDDPYSTEDEDMLSQAKAKLALLRLSPSTTSAQQPLSVPAGIRESGSVDYAWPSVAPEVTGAGASFPAPIYARWASEFHVSKGANVNYQSIGSGAGIKQIRTKAVDFGASDMPLRRDELEKEGLTQFPTVLGGVAVVANLDGVGSGALRLSSEVLANIFLGQVTQWSDPAIKALNPGLSLPDEKINVVRRADATGTTFLFTHFLANVSRDWKAQLGEGTQVNWPVGDAGRGNEGVAVLLQRRPNSIAYVEFAYALQNKLNLVRLRSAGGEYVIPGADTFAAAAEAFDWTGGDLPVLTNMPCRRCWPITGATFVLMHKVVDDPSKAAAVLQFFDWAYRNGASQAEQLLYVPLPTSVVQTVKAGWAVFQTSSGRTVLSRQNQH